MAPVGDRVFVKIDKEEGQTKGGLLLPTDSQRKPTAGQVVAAGDAYMVKVRLRLWFASAACRTISNAYADSLVAHASAARALLRTDGGSIAKTVQPLAARRCAREAGTPCSAPLCLLCDTAGGRPCGLLEVCGH